MTAAKLFRENSIRLIQKRTIVQGREIGEFGVTDCINNKISVSWFQKCIVSAKFKQHSAPQYLDIKHSSKHEICPNAIRNIYLSIFELI